MCTQLTVWFKFAQRQRMRPWRGPRESHFRRDLLLLLGRALSTLFSSERPGWRCSFWSSTSWCSSCFCFSWSTARGWKPRLWWGHFQGWVESLLLIIFDHVACWRPSLALSFLSFIIIAWWWPYWPLSGESTCKGSGTKPCAGKPGEGEISFFL